MSKRPHKQHFAARRDGSAREPGMKHNGTKHNGIIRDSSAHNNSAHDGSTYARRKDSPPAPKAHAMPEPEGNE